MAGTKPNNAGEQQPVDEKSRYAEMSTAELKKRQTINLSDDAATQSVNNSIDERRPPKIVDLPKKEYAELCSAIRTRYADKIPTKGQILYGNNYYRFRYNRNDEEITCTFKVPIIGNEQAISEWMKL